VVGVPCRVGRAVPQAAEEVLRSANETGPELTANVLLLAGSTASAFACASRLDHGDGAEAAHRVGVVAVFAAGAASWTADHSAGAAGGAE
jgi:hypothetical protein